MFRAFYPRIVSLLGIMGTMLQIIGGFLPFTIESDGLNQNVHNADSLWISLVHTVTAMHTATGQYGGAFVQTDFMYYTQIIIICSFLLSVLIPLLAALAGLFNKRWPSLLMLSMLLALLGLLELILLALLVFAISGFCGPEAMSAADCTLIHGGPGLSLTFCGCLLSMVCATVSNVLYKKSDAPYERGSVAFRG